MPVRAEIWSAFQQKAMHRRCQLFTLSAQSSRPSIKIDGRFVARKIALFTPGLIGLTLLAICGPPLYEFFVEPVAPVQAVLFSIQPQCRKKFIYEVRLEFAADDRAVATLILFPKAQTDGSNWSDWRECKTLAVGFPGKIESAFVTRLGDLMSEKPREEHSLKYIKTSGSAPPVQWTTYQIMPALDTFARSSLARFELPALVFTGEITRFVSRRNKSQRMLDAGISAGPPADDTPLGATPPPKPSENESVSVQVRFASRYEVTDFGLRQEPALDQGRTVFHGNLEISPGGMLNEPEPKELRLRFEDLKAAHSANVKEFILAAGFAAAIGALVDFLVRIVDACAERFKS